MRATLVVGISLFVIFLISLVQCESVIQLDPTSFDSVTKEGRWFVKFYAPWCSHCKNLQPVWEELASQENDFLVGEVDCTKHPLLCGRQKIGGYPMMKWYENGESKEYRGPRELEPILEWIKSGAPAGAPVQARAKKQGEVIKITKDNFDELVLEGVWMVNFYSPDCSLSKKFENTWYDLGLHAQDYKVGSIDILKDPELAQRYNVRGTPTVLLFKNGGYFRFSGPRSVDFIDRFARSEGLGQSFHDKDRPEKEPVLPSVKDFTENFEKSISGQNVFVLFYAPWCSHCKKLFPIWNELAAERSDDVIIAKVDGTKNRPLMERYSVRGYPTLLLFSDDGSETEYTGSRTLESFSKWLDSRLGKHIKDEL